MFDMLAGQLEILYSAVSVTRLVAPLIQTHRVKVVHHSHCLQHIFAV